MHPPEVNKAEIPFKSFYVALVEYMKGRPAPFARVFPTLKLLHGMRSFQV
jgi:hypothetical protein